MNEIKCPHCQTVFTIDENSYADIVSQVRNKEFAEDVHKQLEFAKKQFETEKALAKEQEKRLYDEERANFEQKILSLELALKNADVKEEKNVQEALHQKEKEFNALQAELDQLKQQLQFKEVEKLIPEIKNYRGKVKEGAKALLEVFKVEEDMSLKMEQLTIYAFLRKDQDSTNAEYGEIYAKTMNLNSKFYAEWSFLKPELLSIDEDLLLGYVEELDELKVYRFELEKIKVKEVLADIQSGKFADEFLADSKAGQPFLKAHREEASKHQIEKVGQELRKLMPWIK